MPGLFAAAGLALVATLVLMLRSRHRPRLPQRESVSKAAPREANPESEMAALGILEIRPRARGGANAILQAADDPQTATTADPRPSHAPANEDRPGPEHSFDDGAAALHGDGAIHEVPSTDGGSEERGGMDFNAWLARRKESQKSDEYDSTSDESAGGFDDIPESLATSAEAHGVPVDEMDDETNGRQEAVSASRTKQRGPVQSTIMVKERTQALRASIDESAAEHYREMLLPYLQAFRAVVDAHTVCLLRQPVDALHFHIEGIVSVNAYARSGGNFSSKIPLLQTRESHAAVEIRRVAADDFPASGLGYYREPIAVKSLSVAAVPYPSSPDRFVLLADSMREDGLDSERCRSMINHFARLLGTVMENASGLDPAESYDYVRPRREIIAEEMLAARRTHHPLALALVYLNQAESVADRGEREVKVAERMLAAHLRRTARQARVERFGELTFGVFFAATGQEVERWAMRVQHELADVAGPLAGGVSIGIALLQDRHDDADAFRRDATDALREAYESGACTIVEY